MYQMQYLEMYDKRTNDPNSTAFEEPMKLLREDALKTINLSKKNIELLISKIKDFFKENDAEELGDLILERCDYYCEEENILYVFDFSRFAYKLIPKESNLYSILIYLAKFKKDLLSCSKIIQDMSEIFGIMQETKDFEKVCMGIRRSFINNEAAERGIDTEFRKMRYFGQLPEDLFWIKTTNPKEIPIQFQKLGERFTKILEEEDETEFIKQCADFHFDFLQIHPYQEGNGRTARILLSLMLASHNFLIPSLYESIEQKCRFVFRSDAAIYNNYNVIRYDLFQRIAYFYPIQIPAEYRDLFEKDKDEDESEIYY